MLTFYGTDEGGDILVVDPDGNVIGALARLLVNQAGKPTWVTVRTGIYGPKETFIPYQGARWVDGNLHVSVSKYLTTEAPYIAVSDSGPLTPDDEAELHQYYSTPIPPI